jgi:hypothetical protein
MTKTWTGAITMKWRAKTKKQSRHFGYRSSSLIQFLIDYAQLLNSFVSFCWAINHKYWNSERMSDNSY